MNEIAPIGATSATSVATLSDSPAPAMGANDAASFAQMLQNASVGNASYLRQPGVEPAGLQEQMVNYVNSFDHRFHGVFDASIESASQLDLSDPMSMVRILELQTNMFSVTMELELATKLADSGRHFATTLFNNQG
jgi:hypothetical protein